MRLVVSLLALAAGAASVMAQIPPVPADPSAGSTASRVDWFSSATVPALPACRAVYDFADTSLEAFVARSVNLLILPNICESEASLSPNPELTIDGTVVRGIWLSNDASRSLNGRTLVFPLPRLRPLRHTVMFRTASGLTPATSALDVSKIPSPSEPIPSLGIQLARSSNGDFSLLYPRLASAQASVYAVLQRTAAGCIPTSGRDCTTTTSAVKIGALAPGGSMASTFSNLLASINTALAAERNSTTATGRTVNLDNINPMTDSIFVTAISDYFPRVLNRNNRIVPRLLTMPTYEVLMGFRARSQSSMNNTIPEGMSFNSPWLIDYRVSSTWDDYNFRIPNYGNWCRPRNSNEINVGSGSSVAPINGLDSACKDWFLCNDNAQNQQNATSMFCGQLICDNTLLRAIRSGSLCTSTGFSAPYEVSSCIEYAENFDKVLAAQTWINPSVGFCPENPITVVPPNPGTGISWGDPHYTSLDGVGFDFQGLGDFLLSRIFKDDRNEVVIHARNDFPANAQRAVTIQVALAIRSTLTGEIVEFYSNNERNEIFVVASGNAINIPIGTTFNARGMTIRRASINSVAIDTPSRVSLTISAVRWGSWAVGYLDVNFRVHRGAFNTTDGLYGLFNGNNQDDLFLPNGTSLAWNSNNIRTFGNSWRVAAVNSMIPSAAIINSYSITAPISAKVPVSPSAFTRRSSAFAFSASAASGRVRYFSRRAETDPITQVEREAEAAIAWASDAAKTKASGLCSKLSSKFRLPCLIDCSVSTIEELEDVVAAHAKNALQTSLVGVGVTNVKIQASNDSAYVSWEVPAGAPAVDSFIVSYQRLPAAGGWDTATAEASKTGIVITGLWANATYDVRVRLVPAEAPMAATAQASVALITTTDTKAFDIPNPTGETPSAGGFFANSVNVGIVAGVVGAVALAGIIAGTVIVVTRNRNRSAVASGNGAGNMSQKALTMNDGNAAEWDASRSQSRGAMIQMN